MRSVQAGQTVIKRDFHAKIVEVGMYAVCRESCLVIIAHRRSSQGCVPGALTFVQKWLSFDVYLLFQYLAGGLVWNFLFFLFQSLILWQYAIPIFFMCTQEY